MAARTLAALVGAMMLVVAPAHAGEPAPGPTPVRVDRSGALDRGFGVDGVVDSAFGGPTMWEAVMVRTDGTIIAAGSANDDLVIARYDTTGVLDPSFGDRGLVTAPLPHGGRARAVASAGSGDIVVVGSAYGAPENGFPTDVAVLRFDPDGEPDHGFGDGGVVTIDLGQRDEEATAVVAQGSGRIVVLADSNNPESMSPAGSVVLLGFRPDGRPDPTFGEGGRIELRGAVDEVWSADGMVRTPNGDLLVAVSSYEFESFTYRFRLVRFDRDGSELGTSDVIEGFAVGLGLLVDGTVVVHGSFLVDMASINFLRYDAASLELAFDNVSSSSGRGVIAVDLQNRIVVAGDDVRRFFSDAIPDDSFGDGGITESSRYTRHRALALQPDGKIVTAGEVCRYDPKGGFSGCIARVLRYESDATQLCGDVDGDEAYSVTDGVAVLRAAALLASTCSYAVCDVDGDGALGVTDGVNVLRAAAELPAVLRCEAGGDAFVDPSRRPTQ